MDKKIRTGICISISLLQECDAYIKAGNAENRSALIEDALRLFLASRELKDKHRYAHSLLLYKTGDKLLLRMMIPFRIKKEYNQIDAVHRKRKCSAAAS